MNKLLKKTLKILLPVALGGFILYWVYRDFDFARAKEVLLHGTNWGWMLFSLFFGVMSHVFRGWRWKQTLAPLGAYPKTSDCVDAIFVSYAANLVLPRVGEVSRCGMLAKYDGPIRDRSTTSATCLGISAFGTPCSNTRSCSCSERSYAPWQSLSLSMPSCGYLYAVD